MDLQGQVAKNIHNAKECKMNLRNISEEITNEIRFEYERNGIICVRGVFQEYLLDSLRLGVEKALISKTKNAEDIKENGGRFFEGVQNSV
jgi:hypothetical protein